MNKPKQKNKALFLAFLGSLITIIGATQVPTNIDPGTSDDAKSLQDNPEYIILLVALIAVVVLFFYWSRRRRK